MAPLTATPTTTYDVSDVGTRGLNAALQSTAAPATVTVVEPAGAHALACGLDAPIDVRIDGHVGYYAAGMNQRATVTIDGNAGVGVAENMMSGTVRVTGDASQSAGATAHGGLLVIEGNAAARCGISMKGVDIVVGGSIGHMSAFMGQAGRLVVLGDAVRRWVIRCTRPVSTCAEPLPPSGPTASRRRCATNTGPNFGNCSTPRVSTPTPPSSPVTARPQSLTTSTFDTPRLLTRAIFRRPHDPRTPRAARIRDVRTATSSTRSSAAAETGIYYIRGCGAKRKLPHFDDLCSWAHRCPANPLSRVIASVVTPTSCSVTATRSTHFPSIFRSPSRA